MPGRVPRRMIGRICKHLDAIQAAKLYNQTRGTDTKDHAYKKQVLLSSGGALAGPIWTEIPVQGQYFLTSHFIMATRRRLGVVQIQQGMTCQLTEGANTANARPCGEILDRRLTHPCANCGKGPAKNRAHEFLKYTLSEVLHSAQAQQDIERLVPELCRGDTSNGRGADAIMDIVASFPNATRQYWIDVTVRSPHADRYNESGTRNAANTVAFAASEGVKEKWDKYKSELVVPISFEPYGRLAPKSFQCLEEMAINGATISAHRWAGAQLLKKWLQSCQRMVIWASTDVALASLGRGATKMEAAIARGAFGPRSRAPSTPAVAGVRAANLGGSSQSQSQSTSTTTPRRVAAFPHEQHTGMQYRSLPLGGR
jgi:hypothetical protein